MATWFKSTALSLQLARYSLVLIWAYHGLVPKIIFMAPSELAIMQAAGFTGWQAEWLLRAAGAAELLMALLFYFGYRQPWLHYINLSCALGLTLAISWLQPLMLVQAFNPVSTNLALAVLSLIALAELAKAEPRNHSD